MNILITSAGRRVSLIRFFKKELKYYNKDSKLLTTDYNPQLAPACIISDNYYKVPKVTNTDYISILLEISLKNNVKIIIPTIDTELLILSKNKKLFDEHNINVIVSDENIINNCRDKRKTHKLFEYYGIDYAKEIDVDNIIFPIFVKPYNGSRSIDIHVWKNKNDIVEDILNDKKYLFLEYLDPSIYNEYTIDMYYDKNSKLKCVVPRQRIEIRAGEVSKSITRKNELVEYIYNKFNYLPGAFGCITLQLFKKNNVIKAIEINPRFGGGYPLSYIAGANFPKYIIDEYFFNKDISINNNWENNLLMLRYDDEIIVRNYES